MEQITVFWFRRDLRTHDNKGLYQALKENRNVLPLFIFDTEILDKLDDKTDRRVSFIYDELLILKKEFEKHGSSLLIKYGKTDEIFAQLTQSYKVVSVYANHDYEPYARKRDAKIGSLLFEMGIPFNTFKDQVIFEKAEIAKDDGLPYTVFTPYMKKWRSGLQPDDLTPFSSEELLKNCLPAKAFPDFDLSQTGFSYVKFDYPGKEIHKEIISNYQNTRDFPAIAGTSKLSVHLRFGTISIRRLVRFALEQNQTFLNELIWREFYMMILWHYPHVEKSAFKPQYDKLQWLNDEKQFFAWCEGQTGYPIVDAGMRQLNETGFMHNRVRMITASFLTKHLLIDWRWGEAYFAKKLLDFELSSNNGGWQWAAGSGCDAAPYFRVFSPELQTKKFDPELIYIKKWVPEFHDFSYPKPIVDHKTARERALEEYKRALSAEG